MYKHSSPIWAYGKRKSFTENGTRKISWMHLRFYLKIPVHKSFLREQFRVFHKCLSSRWIIFNFNTLGNLTGRKWRMHVALLRTKTVAGYISSLIKHWNEFSVTYEITDANHLSLDNPISVILQCYFKWAQLLGTWCCWIMPQPTKCQSF